MRQDIWNANGSLVVPAVLITFLVDWGLYRARAWTQGYAAQSAQRLRQGWAQVEQFVRKQFHYFE